MSTWPSCAGAPDAAELLHWRNPGGNSTFDLGLAGWPDLIPAILPLHIVKVCAVAIHRDELQLTEAERADNDFVCKIPGYEFSGYVVSTSPHSPLEPGTEVYGRTSFKRTGNARSYTVAKFHELACMPDKLSWAQAATMPIGGLVAYQALFKYRLLREPAQKDWGRTTWETEWNHDTTILITGAATPAGVWAVQLAKLAGAGKIVATCDAENMDLVLDIGAHEVYDWAKEGTLADWDKGHFSVVLDLMGGRTLTRAWSVVAEGGKILSVAGDVLDAKPAVVNPGIQHFDFTLENCPKHLHIIGALTKRNLATPVCDPDDVFPHTLYEEAMQRLSSHPRGQVVLTLDSHPPKDEIQALDKYGDKWDENDFNTYNMTRASTEDPAEKFEFVRWLQMEGSNHPVLAPPTPAELMPPPPAFLARSKSKRPAMPSTHRKVTFDWKRKDGGSG